MGSCPLDQRAVPFGALGPLHTGFLVGKRSVRVQRSGVKFPEWPPYIPFCLPIAGCGLGFYRTRHVTR
ncbi:unnamed protein product [Arctogadus glacialis]